MIGLPVIKRLTALIVLSSLVYPVASAQSQVSAPATKTAATTELAVNPQAKLNSALLQIRSNAPVKVLVSVGTDVRNMADWRGASSRTSWEVNLAPLAPNTLYFYHVTATDRRGHASSSSGSFKTQQVDRPVMGVNGSRITLDGLPFFPVMAMAFNECPSQQVVADDVALGVNMMYHNTWYGCPNNSTDRQNRYLTADELHGLLGGQVGWIQDGSRSGSGPPPPQMPPLPSWDSLPELVGLQGNFRVDWNTGGVAGCGQHDSSPAAIFNQLHAESLHSAIVPLTVLTATVGPNRNCLTPQMMPAVFWTAVLAGAAGIQFKTQQNAFPEDGVEVNPGLKTAAGQQAKRLAALYPVVFDGRTITVSSNSGNVKVLAKSWGGNQFIFALNTGGETNSAKLKLTVGGSKAKVLWENRNVSANGGIINDRFGPYQLHVYELTG